MWSHRLNLLVLVFGVIVMLSVKPLIGVVNPWVHAWPSSLPFCSPGQHLHSYYKQNMRVSWSSDYPFLNLFSEFGLNLFTVEQICIPQKQLFSISWTFSNIWYRSIADSVSLWWSDTLALPCRVKPNCCKVLHSFPCLFNDLVYNTFVFHPSIEPWYICLLNRCIYACVIHHTVQPNIRFDSNACLNLRSTSF